MGHRFRWEQVPKLHAVGRFLRTDVRSNNVPTKVNRKRMRSSITGKPFPSFYDKYSLLRSQMRRHSRAKVTLTKVGRDDDEQA